MKILVCTDGSKHSEKMIEEASEIAEDMKKVDAVTIIHTYKRKYSDTAWSLSAYNTWSEAEVELMRKQMEKLDEQENKERKKVLEAAAEVFKKKNIEVNTILKEGHPAKTICEVASAEGFDLIIIGSKGRGGLLGVFLGSVSNAVVQNCETNVLVVK